MFRLFQYFKATLGLVAVGLVVVGAPAVGAYPGDSFETVDLESHSIYLRAGEMRSVYLEGGSRMIRKAYIQAIGQYGDATFEVIVNGDVKGTIHVPGSDPSYVVTIGEVAGSLQLRHLSGGTAIIRDIKVVQSARSVSEGPRERPEYSRGALGLPWYNEASFVAREAIRLVDELRPYANYIEYGNYLLPIKKLAGQLYASAEARGAASLNVRGKLIALKQQIEFSGPYLEATFEREYAFELSVAMKSLGEKIDRMLP